MKSLRIIIILGVILLSIPALHAQDFLQKAKNYMAAGECENARKAYKAYKVEYPEGNAEVERWIAACEGDSLGIIPSGYVDLGLPSGTLWKNKNESNEFYTYAQAEELFRDNLPAIWQWEELKNKCTWEWTGNGYTIIGKNGNSIFLPVTGCRTDAGHLKGIGDRGFYWAYTPKGLDGALSLFFNKEEMRTNEDVREAGLSVRLVQ